MYQLRSVKPRKIVVSNDDMNKKQSPLPKSKSHKFIDDEDEYDRHKSRRPSPRPTKKLEEPTQIKIKQCGFKMIQQPAVLNVAQNKLISEEIVTNDISTEEKEERSSDKVINEEEEKKAQKQKQQQVEREQKDIKNDKVKNEKIEAKNEQPINHSPVKEELIINKPRGVPIKPAKKNTNFVMVQHTQEELPEVFTKEYEVANSKWYSLTITVSDNKNGLLKIFDNSKNQLLPLIRFPNNLFREDDGDYKIYFKTFEKNSANITVYLVGIKISNIQLDETTLDNIKKINLDKFKNEETSEFYDYYFVSK